MLWSDGPILWFHDQHVSDNLGNLGSLLTGEARPDVSDFTDVKDCFGAKCVMGRKERAQHYLPRLFGYGWCDYLKYGLTTPYPLETRINTGLEYGWSSFSKYQLTTPHSFETRINTGLEYGWCDWCKKHWTTPGYMLFRRLT